MCIVTDHYDWTLYLHQILLLLLLLFTPTYYCIYATGPYALYYATLNLTPAAPPPDTLASPPIRHT